MAENKRFCADVISVLAMTNSEGTETLHYRLQGSHEEIGEEDGKGRKMALRRDLGKHALSFVKKMKNRWSSFLDAFSHLFT